MSQTNDTDPREEATPAQEQAPDEEVAETSEPAGETPEAETAEEDGCQKELETAKAELAAEQDKYLRLRAEYDNFRKRSARERDNLYTDIKADVIVKLLPVYDNLERALAAATEDEAYRKGVEMTLQQFLEALGGMGVTPIDAVGATFDPALHNAVMREAGEEPGKVLEVFQKGYKVKDKIIRYAMVKVAVEE